MKFLFEKFLTSRNNVICVDGAFDAKLQLSHWYGNKSPVELKADTTTQMAFNLIEHKNKDKYLQGIKIVSNNHYDADGVLSAFVLLYQDFALKNKSSLINISLTGDFSEFTTENALKANIVIESFADENKSIFKDIFLNEDYPSAIQIIYEKVFEIIPKLISQLDNFENIWLEEYNHFEKSEKSFGTRESVVSNYDDCNLSVVESNFPLHSVAKFMNAENDILLSVVRSEEGNTYELDYKYYTWFDTLRPKKIKRKNFESLAQKLNQIELNTNGFWQIIGNSPILDWNYRLIFADKNLNLLPSGLKVFEIENKLFEHL
jgi:hypothetical protein